MGFCLLNNVALAAQYLIQEEGAQRLAIVDVDLHHGNGTQDIFYHRKDVFYFSTHQYPHYPGTGSLDEMGEGEGVGYTANFPLPPFSGDKAFQVIMEELLLPLLHRYQPEMILVSYGFDPHWRDPLGSLLLSAGGFHNLVKALTAWADEHCEGRIAVFLEGGYDLEAARVCSLAVVAALLNKPWQDDLGSSPTSVEREYWKTMVQQAKQLWNL
jgi:acetoin utilization deacetylase AcuC-like enzyme